MTEREWVALVMERLRPLLAEVQASRALEEMIYHSRRRGRKRYTILQRPLRLQEAENN